MNITNFIKTTLNEAKKAAIKNEVPVAAIIIDSNQRILAKAHNKIEKQNCQIAHAELIAIKKATKKIGNWRLNGTTLYVNLEPCCMCLGAIALSRISKVIYFTKSLQFGINLNLSEIKQIYKNLDIELEFIENIESLNLLKSFFKKKRKNLDVKQKKT